MPNLMTIAVLAVVAMSRRMTTETEMEATANAQILFIPAALLAAKAVQVVGPMTSQAITHALTHSTMDHLSSVLTELNADRRPVIETHVHFKHIMSDIARRRHALDSIVSRRAKAILDKLPPTDQELVEFFRHLSQMEQYAEATIHMVDALDKSKTSLPVSPPTPILRDMLQLLSSTFSHADADALSSEDQETYNSIMAQVQRYQAEAHSAVNDIEDMANVLDRLGVKGSSRGAKKLDGINIDHAVAGFAKALGPALRAKSSAVSLINSIKASRNADCRDFERVLKQHFKQVEADVQYSMCSSIRDLVILAQAQKVQFADLRDNEAINGIRMEEPGSVDATSFEDGDVEPTIVDAIAKALQLHYEYLSAQFSSACRVEQNQNNIIDAVSANATINKQGGFAASNKMQKWSQPPLTGIGTLKKNPVQQMQTIVNRLKGKLFSLFDGVFRDMGHFATRYDAAEAARWRIMSVENKIGDSKTTFAFGVHMCDSSSEECLGSPLTALGFLHHGQEQLHRDKIVPPPVSVQDEFNDREYQPVVQAGLPPLSVRREQLIPDGLVAANSAAFETLYDILREIAKSGAGNMAIPTHAFGPLVVGVNDKPSRLKRIVTSKGKEKDVQYLYSSTAFGAPIVEVKMCTKEEEGYLPVMPLFDLEFTACPSNDDIFLGSRSNYLCYRKQSGVASLPSDNDVLEELKKVKNHQPPTPTPSPIPPPGREGSPYPGSGMRPGQGGPSYPGTGMRPGQGGPSYPGDSSQPGQGGATSSTESVEV